MPRSVVCISHSSGAGGEEIGRLVADRLGFRYVDEELISRAAERGGFDPETAADAERRKTIFAGLLDYLREDRADPASPTSSPASGEPPSEAVRSFIRDAIHEVAEQGNAVIVAHAASYAVGGGRDVLRVLVTAPSQIRAKRLAAESGLGELEAERTISRSDAGRADYVKRFYGVLQEVPTDYDLVVNTDTVGLERASALIVQAATDQ